MKEHSIDMADANLTELETLKGYFTVTAALIAIIGALGGSFLTLAGTWLTSFVTFKVHRRSLFVSTVTNERAQWRKDLRSVTTEFVGLAYQLAAGKDVDLGAFHRLRLEIRLRTNPNGGAGNALDAEILAALENISQALAKTEKPSVREMATLLEPLEDSVQRLLKQEWDKSKEEARSGQLQERPHS